MILRILFSVVSLALSPAFAATGAGSQALERAAAEAGFAAPTAPQPVPGTAVAPDRPFCTSDFYVYHDRPITSYSLACRNDALGLHVYHAASYDQAALFSPNGRCSPKHLASVSVWSRDTGPFRLGHDNSRPSSGRREFTVFREGPGLRDGELLVNLLWIQGSDELRLGFDPRTGRTPMRPFVPGPRSESGSKFVLRGRGLPFNFSTQTRINGRVIGYRDVPVDCTLEIDTDDWVGR